MRGDADPFKSVLDSHQIFSSMHRISRESSFLQPSCWLLLDLPSKSHLFSTNKLQMRNQDRKQGHKKIGYYRNNNVRWLVLTSNNSCALKHLKNTSFASKKCKMKNKIYQNLRKMSSSKKFLILTALPLTDSSFDGLFLIVIYTYFMHHKNIRLLISEVKAVGLYPTKTIEAIIDDGYNFRQFAAKIKEKFEQFNPKNYTVFLPDLAGITIHKHNFIDYLARARVTRRYMNVHILRNQNDKDYGWIPTSDEDSEEDSKVDKEEKVTQMAAQYDDQPEPEQQPKALERVFAGNVTNSNIIIKEKDLELLRELKVIAPSTPFLPITPLKQKVTTQVLIRMQKC